MENNTYKQLRIDYQEALKPLWSIYTCDPDDCYDTIDGPQRIFMDSYDLCLDLSYAEQDEQVPSEDKAAIQRFVELRSKLDKLGCGPHFSLFEELRMSADERKAAWNRYYDEVIPVTQELLAATPPFVSAMYAYNGKTAPAST